MQKKLMNNLLLKILSVVIAFFIWLIVANANDPVVVKSYNVPVTIQNSAYLESGGMTYQVLEEQQVVTVILKGNSSVVENRAADIVAVADLTQIVNMDTTPVMVPVTVTCDKVAAENISVVPSAIGIEIEEIVSKDFTITVTAGETTPNKDYEVGTMEAKPEKVTVTGPESLIAKIDRVSAEVDVSMLKADTKKSCRLKVYDKNQDELSTTQMDYLKFDIGEPVIEVAVDLWEVRNDVDLIVNYSGAPAQGYQVSEVMITPSTVAVAGTDEALKTLAQNGNKIEIPADAVVVEGQSDDFETKLNLADYLPENIILANEARAAIVNVSIIPLGSRQFTVQTKNIGINNLEDNLRLVFDTDKVVVRVKGYNTNLDSLTVKDLEISVDMTGKKAGDYEVELNVKLPYGCELLEPVTALVHVSELAVINEVNENGE